MAAVLMNVVTAAQAPCAPVRRGWIWTPMERRVWMLMSAAMVRPAVSKSAPIMSGATSAPVILDTASTMTAADVTM